MIWSEKSEKICESQKIWSSPLTLSLYNTFKESNTHGHKFSVKTKLSRLDKTFLVYKKYIFWTVYWKILSKHWPLICSKIGLIDTIGKETYYFMVTLAIMDEIIFNRFAIVAVMGQLHEGEYW